MAEQHQGQEQKNTGRVATVDFKVSFPSFHDILNKLVHPETYIAFMYFKERLSMMPKEEAYSDIVSHLAVLKNKEFKSMDEVIAYADELRRKVRDYVADRSRELTSLFSGAFRELYKMYRALSAIASRIYKENIEALNSLYKALSSNNVEKVRVIEVKDNGEKVEVVKSLEEWKKEVREEIDNKYEELLSAINEWYRSVATDIRQAYHKAMNDLRELYRKAMAEIMRWEVKKMEEIAKKKYGSPIIYGPKERRFMYV